MTRMVLRVYFLNRHVRYTMVILEEEPSPQPRRPCFDMVVPWAELNVCHTTTAHCTKGAEGKRRRLVAEEMRKSMVRAFQAYARSLNTVTSFKYLGYIMMTLNDNWLALVRNL